MKNCRWKYLLGAAAFAGAVGLAAPPPVWAVHLTGLFELEGNTTDEGAAGDDWNTLHGGGGSATEFTGINPDRNGVDDVFHGGGSKDTRDTALGGATGTNVWAWTTVTSASPPKDDITNAYAAAYLCDAAAALTGNCDLGDLIVYFGLDRFKTDGTAQMGFWFFQNEISQIEVNGNKVFSDIHVVGDFVAGPPSGDILVLVEVSKGGTVPNVRVLEWVGSGGDGKQGGTLQTIVPATAANCIGAPGGDSVCAVTNASTTAPAWPYLDDDGNSSFQPQAFFEGGINLTRLLGTTPCLSTFLAETRSSGAPLTETAQLKDKLDDAFVTCDIDASKACLPNPASLQCEDGSSCTVDADCAAIGFGERCVDTNPFVDNDGATFIVKFDVGIFNDGFGVVHDPVIREDIAYVAANALSDNTGDEEECFVTAIEGDDSFTPVYLPSGSFVELDDAGLFGGAAVASIAALDTLNVEVTCDTPRQELVNVVTIGANVTDENDATRITEQFAMTSQGNPGANTCRITPPNNLLISKECVEARLMRNVDDELVVEALVSITIENDGEEVLTSVQITDDKICSGPSDFCIASGETLLPGEMKTFYASYMPSSPTTNPIDTCQGSIDIGEACNSDADCRSNIELGEIDVCLPTTDKFTSGTAMFEDTARVEGTGLISGDILGDGNAGNGGTAPDIIEDSATCELCP